MDLSMHAADDHCQRQPTATTVAAAATTEWFELGHFGVAGYKQPDFCGMVVLDPSSPPQQQQLLAKPIGFTQNWVDVHDDRVKGSKGGGLFTPVCPDGFVALGSVALYRQDIATNDNVTTDDFPRLRCVAEALALKVPAANLTLVWDDHGSRMDECGTVWNNGEHFDAKQVAHHSRSTLIRRDGAYGKHQRARASGLISSGDLQYTVAAPSVAGASTSYDAPADTWVLNPASVKLSATPLHTCAPPEQVCE